MATTYTTMDSNVHIKGNLSAETMDIPAGTIVSADVSASAAIAAAKLVHRFPVRHSQNEGAVVADETVGIHIAAAAGVVASIEVVCTSTAPVGNSTVTVDLQKSTAGGAFATMLSSVVTIDSANTVRVAEAGTLSGTAYVDGDILELIIDATVGSGTLPTGMAIVVTLQENPS